MPKAGWMHQFPRVTKSDQFHHQIASIARDIRDSAVIGNILGKQSGQSGVQKALEDYTEKVVTDKLNGTAESTNPLKQKIAEKIDLMTDYALARQLSGESTPPAPNSTQDVIAAAKALTELNSTVTQLALDERDRAVEDRENTEAQIGQTIERTRAEEQQKAASLMDIVTKSFENQMTMLNRFTSLQVEVIRKDAEAQVANTEAKSNRILEEVKQMFATALSAKDQQIALIQTQNDAQLSLLKESHQHELALKDMEKTQLVNQAQSQSHQNVAPWEAHYRTRMADILADDAAVQAVDKHNKSMADQGFKDAAAEALKAAPAALTQLVQTLAQLAAPANPDTVRNGIPGIPPNPEGRSNPGGRPNAARPITPDMASNPLANSAMPNSAMPSGAPNPMSNGASNPRPHDMPNAAPPDLTVVPRGPRLASRPHPQARPAALTLSASNRLDQEMTHG